MIEYRSSTEHRPSAIAVLRAHNLTKRFGGLRAVDGFSLDVAAQEIVGLIGPNGAGKTTLFNMLAGALPPDGGDIILDGQSVAREGAAARIGRSLARTFQIPRPFAEMTVLDNALVAGQGQTGEAMLGALFGLRKVAREETRIRARAHALLEFLDLARLADDPAATLSGGQRKLLELARALMAEPRVLLLDEPAAGVNPALMDFIMDRIEAINTAGVTVLLIEHNMSVVERLCGRAVVMAEGRLFCEGPPAKVMADPKVVDAYLGAPAA